MIRQTEAATARFSRIGTGVSKEPSVQEWNTKERWKGCVFRPLGLQERQTSGHSPGSWYFRPDRSQPWALQDWDLLLPTASERGQAELACALPTHFMGLLPANTCVLDTTTRHLLPKPSLGTARKQSPCIAFTLDVIGKYELFQEATELQIF